MPRPVARRVLLGAVIGLPITTLFQHVARAQARIWQCQTEECGYIYDPDLGDPDRGIAPGTAFEDLPDDWLCPNCGSPKSAYIRR